MNCTQGYTRGYLTPTVKFIGFMLFRIGTGWPQVGFLDARIASGLFSRNHFTLFKCCSPIMLLEVPVDTTRDQQQQKIKSPNIKTKAAACRWVMDTNYGVRSSALHSKSFLGTCHGTWVQPF